MDRRRFLAITAGAVALPMAAAEEKKTIKIVSSLPRTGSAKGQTDAMANGIHMAIAEYEKKVPFEVKYEDKDDATAALGQWDPVTEARNAEAAIEDEDVVAFIGPYNSGAARISMPILNKAGIVQITPSATYPGLTLKTANTEMDEPDRYRPSKRITFCRVCPRDDSQGSLAAIYVAKELKANSVYILDDGEIYGKMCAATFAAECKKHKLTELGHDSIDLHARNYRGLMEAVKKSGPEAVYFGGTTQSKGPTIARDFVASGMKCPLILPDGCYEEAFISAAGDDISNGKCLFTIGGIDSEHLAGRGAEFAKRYKERFRTEPGAYSIYGYEAAVVILEAIKGVGKKDREAIRKAVLATKNFDKGALDKWSFDANGDTTLQQITVSKVEKGKFVPVKVVSSDSPA